MKYQFTITEAHRTASRVTGQICHCRNCTTCTLRLQAGHARQALGRILPSDVGKEVWKDRVHSIYYVENEAQRAARLRGTK